MLSNLIWGSPVKAVEEESESGEDIDSDDDDEDNDGPDALSFGIGQQSDVQISSDEEDEQQEATRPQSPASTASSAPRRFTAAEKGKGSPKRTDSYSTTKYLPQQSTFSHGLRPSQTFGDMRSIQHNIGMDIPTSTPNTSIAQQRDDLPSPGDVNSQLAHFFSAKGTASLTADERKKISEILLGGSSSAGAANPDVPTALTPNFSFHVPVPSTVNANASILSPAYKGLARSSNASGGLSNLASKAIGGLSGSQSLSSLSTLANGTGTGSSAAANPRSALNRRQARPLYLGAGYSSQAIARRKRVQAQMGSLYSNLNSFDSTSATTVGPSVAATPAKRRRVGEDAASSTAVGARTPARSANNLADAPPAFSVESPEPLTSTPGLSKATQHPALFQSAPHLRAQFASTPAKPSPLRAAAVATPSPPAKAAEPSPPRTISKTAGFMRNIVGDTSESQGRPNKPATSAAGLNNEKTRPATPITMTRTSKPINRVPREELIKRAEPPSAAEILERSMPPELRPTPNGKQARPKPPPVPGSARKTRAAAAAAATEDANANGNADTDAQKEQKRKSTPQVKENLRVPPTRRSKSRSKTPDVPSASGTETETAKSTTTKMTAGKTVPGDSGGMQVDDDVTSTTAAAPTKSAFSFRSGGGTPPMTGSSLFGSKGSFSAANEAENGGSTAPFLPSRTPAFHFGGPSKPQAASVDPSSPRAFFESKNAPRADVDNTAEATADVPARTKEGVTDEDSASQAATTILDGKAEALKTSTVALPSFTLYETHFSFASSSNDEQEDITVKALKETVLEMPRNEMVVFDLL